MSISLSQEVTEVPVDIIDFVMKNCPRIRSIFVHSTSTAEFKIMQVNENNGYVWGRADEGSALRDNSALVKVIMNHIDLTQNALDQLSRCLPNIRLLITLKGWEPTFNQQQVDRDARISSLKFMELKKLKKFALDINHFIPSGNKTGHLFIQLVYGQDHNKEEAYYQLVLKDRHRDHSFCPTTKRIINQQKGNTNSHLVAIHFYERLEELIVTDLENDDFSTPIYARITGGELQQYNDELKHSNWFDYFYWTW